MNKTTVIKVKNATYLDGYRLRIAFTDGKEKIVDFAEFITTSHKEVIAKYRTYLHFKKFKIEQGNIVWGKNWDLIFPVIDLYTGRICSS